MTDHIDYLIWNEKVFIELPNIFNYYHSYTILSTPISLRKLPSLSKSETNFEKKFTKKQVQQVALEMGILWSVYF